MKCAVGNCKQSNSKKTTVSFYSFPRDEAQRKLWVIFCKRVKSVNVEKEKICALHFKQEDFERNLIYEMGFSKRSAKKLRPHAVPSIENTVIDSEKKIAYDTEEDETKKQINNQKSLEVKYLNAELPTDIEEDGLQNYTKTLELKIIMKQSGFTIVAIVCDLGGGNRKLLSELEVDYKKPWSKGGLHDHPDREEFKYRLRSYLMGSNEGILGSSANVEVDNTPDLDVNNSLTGTVLKSVNRNIQVDILTEANKSEIQNMEYDGLENLAGYICHKLKNENPDLVSNSSSELNYSWVNHLSEGGLSKPSTSLMNTLRLCDSVFSKLYGDKLLLTSRYLQKHLLEAKEIEARENVKKNYLDVECILELGN